MKFKSDYQFKYSWDLFPSQLDSRSKSAEESAGHGDQEYLIDLAPGELEFTHLILYHIHLDLECVCNEGAYKNAKEARSEDENESFIEVQQRNPNPGHSHGS